MRHSIRRRAVTVCVATSAVLAVNVGYGYAAPAEGAIRGANEPGAIAGAYIVALKDNGFGAAKAGDLARRYGGRVGHTYTTASRGFSVRLDQARARRLAADPAVEYGEQDGIATATGTQTNPTWGLDRVDQKALPLDAKFTYANTASNVNAHIVDTGVYKHTDFGGRVVDGFDFVDNDKVAQDCNGHGTHVAGTVGSATYGVAKGVKITAVRVLNCEGQGAWSQVVAGIDWVAKNHVKPAVANMSLGGGANSSVDNAVRRAITAGVTFAVASGNDNRNACSSSPARVPEAITVNASDRTDTRSSFSDHGTCTDLFAPGSSITSTWNNGSTNTINGTSMATPHVAGAAALYLSAHPAATPAQVASALTTNATTGAIKNPGAGSPDRLLSVGFLGGRVTPAACATSDGPDCAGVESIKGKRPLAHR
ncbi:hypothetical protein GCM10022243_23120 [Saccharothrix violaceirubra]|uniref:Subtilisin family serine protease n=1 Tax=Saccharothrix violaceirubra TaxID=413306 RepID=A0A7W7T1D4_9PSEU|nr:S8 family peptidase [Saccharothrix violaceirubra]MBB4964749.1 subtilisin family serine protease [Saccharothrix violaceirubra]